MGPDRASSEILGNVTPRLPNEGRLEWKRYVNWNFLIKSSTWRLELNPAVFSVLEISSPMFLWWNKTPCRLPWLHKPAPVFRPQGKSRRKAPAWKRGISGLRRGPTCSRKWTDPARLPPADPRSSIPPASSFTYAGKNVFFLKKQNDLWERKSLMSKEMATFNHRQLLCEWMDRKMWMRELEWVAVCSRADNAMQISLSPKNSFHKSVVSCEKRRWMLLGKSTLGMPLCWV